VSPPPEAAPEPRKLDPLVVGTLCGLSSAVIYTAANSFLRSVKDCDPVWVSAVKALPTAVCMAPWLLLMLRRGQRLAPSWRIVLMIALAALSGQLVGNVAFQWGLHEVGVAMTVPLSLGGMIVSAAILGRVFLHEPVTLRTAAALLLLLVAIGVLSLGAADARQSVVKASATPLELAAGVAAGCLAGLAYSVLNVVIRYGVLRGMPLPTTLFTVSIVGLVSLGPWSWLRIGGQGIAATAPHDLGLMLLAGACNTLAFLALTKSLQLTSVVYVNALNAAQAALAALAGVLVFGEALSQWLLHGIVLTILGLAIMTRRRQPLPPQEP
jgi:drug/metabolite transporter (DMT)-like permease